MPRPLDSQHLGELNHPTLGGTIGRVVGQPHQPRVGADHDDLAPTAPDHPRRDLLTDEERGLEIDIQGGVPVRLRGLQSTLRIGQAGVIGQDVYTIQEPVRLLSHANCRRRVRQVGHQHVGAAAEPADARRHLCETLFVAAGHSQVTPGMGQGKRRMKADSLAGTGDECLLPRQIEAGVVHGSSPVGLRGLRQRQRRLTPCPLSLTPSRRAGPARREEGEYGRRCCASARPRRKRGGPRRGVPSPARGWHDRPTLPDARQAGRQR